MFFLKNSKNFFLIFKFFNIIVNKVDNYRGRNYCLDIFFSTLNIKRYFFCHRLDKEVLGILFVIKNEVFFQLMKKKFFLKKTKKNYISFNYGLANSNIKINNNLLISSINKNKFKQSISIFGKISLSYFFFMYSYSFFSIFNVIIFTGRTHQIRIHSLFRGFPIINDNLYSSSFYFKYVFLFFYSIDFLKIRIFFYKNIRIIIPPLFFFFLLKNKCDFYPLFYRFKFS